MRINMRKMYFTLAIICAICNASCSQAASRLGRYVYVKRSGNQVERSSIELKRNGVVLLTSPRATATRGAYTIQGSTVKFRFKAANVIGDEGHFVGSSLCTYLKALAEGDDPGDYDPKFPLGYPHKKQR